MTLLSYLNNTSIVNLKQHVKVFLTPLKLNGIHSFEQVFHVHHIQEIYLVLTAKNLPGS